MANGHYQALLRSLERLMEQGEYSDLMIVCGVREWPVHKAIVCSNSPVLAKECDSEKIEGMPGRIEHSEFDADTVDRMICYIYKRTYDVKIHDYGTATEEHLLEFCDSNGNKQAPGVIKEHENSVNLSETHAVADLSQDTTHKRSSAPDFVLDMIQELVKQRRPEIIQYGKTLEAKESEIEDLQGQVQSGDEWSESYKRRFEDASEISWTL